MKSKKRISFFTLGLVWVLLFSIMVSAALPPTAEQQWQNINAVVCGIIITVEGGTARASINGVTGSYVEARATLYQIVGSIPIVVYVGTTPENNPMPYASFTYPFVPESGTSYYLFLYGVVSKDGIEEEIQESDIVAIP